MKLRSFFLKKEGECLKILTLKQILPWLSIAYAQVKAGNIPGNLQNEVRQIIHKIDLWRKDKYIALSNLSIFYTWKILKLCNRNNFKMSAPIRNQKLELPDESYSISDVQDYFEYIFEKHGGKLLIPL